MDNKNVFEIWGITELGVKFHDTVNLNAKNVKAAITELKNIGIDKDKHIDFGIRKTNTQ